MELQPWSFISMNNVKMEFIDLDAARIKDEPIDSDDDSFGSDSATETEVEDMFDDCDSDIISDDDNDDSGISDGNVMVNGNTTVNDNTGDSKIDGTSDNIIPIDSDDNHNDNQRPRVSTFYGWCLDKSIKIRYNKRGQLFIGAASFCKHLSVGGNLYESSSKNNPFPDHMRMSRTIRNNRGPALCFPLDIFCIFVDTYKEKLIRSKEARSSHSQASIAFLTATQDVLNASFNVKKLKREAPILQTYYWVNGMHGREGVRDYALRDKNRARVIEDDC